MNLTAIVSNMTLEQKIGQLIIAGFETASPDDPHFLTLIKDYHVGNVILFTRNLGSRDDTIRLTDGIRKRIMDDSCVPPFVVIDQEGGMVTRIFRAGNVVPGPMAIGATYDTKNAYIAGGIIAREMRALGMNFDFAPCVEEAIFRTPSNISVRAFSDNPYMVAAFCAEFARGLQDNGVVATLKHFPGYTGVLEDAHHDVPTVRRTKNELEKIELNAFRQAIAGGADAVMAGHMLCPALEPTHTLTSASRRVMTDLLKTQLGFRGLVASDCMDMNSLTDFYPVGRGAVELFKAGVHMLDISHTLENQAKACQALREAVLSGEIPMAQLNETVLHILSYKQKYGLFDACPPADARVKAVDWAQNRRECQRISQESITLTRGEALLPLTGENGLFISPPPVSLMVVDEKVDAGNTFASAAAQRFRGDAREIPLNPTDDMIASLVTRAKDAPYVVIGTYNAFCNEGQQKLLTALSKANKNVIAVCLRAPYDHAYYEGIPCCVLAYEYTVLSIQSVIKVLSGAVSPTGISPIGL